MAESDLAAGKKTLPVLYGLQKDDEFARRWLGGPILPAEVPEMAKLLEAEGAREYAQRAADRLTAEALSALEAADPLGIGWARFLGELAGLLLKRVDGYQTLNRHDTSRIYVWEVLL